MKKILNYVIICAIIVSSMIFIVPMEEVSANDVFDSGIYYIRNVKNGLYLHVQDASTGNAGHVVQWTYINEAHQKWKIEKSGSYYKIVPTHAPDMAIEPSGINSISSIRIWDKNQSNQDYVLWSIVKNSNGSYRFLSKYASGKALAVYDSTSIGTRIIIDDNNGTANGDWELVPVFDEECYYIRNVKNGLYLHVQDANTVNLANVVQWTYTSEAHQKWKIEKSGNYYKIVPFHAPDKALEPSSSTSNSSVRIYNKNQSNQDWVLWNIERKTNGTYRILSKYASGKALAVGTSTTNGSSIIINDNNGTTNGDWEIIPVFAENTYYIRNVKNGLYLDVYNLYTSNGSSVVQWTLFGGLNQKWKIEKSGNYYKIVPAHAPDKALEPSNINSNSSIRIWEKNQSNQDWVLWSIERKTNGTYRILSKYASGKALAVGTSTINGSNIIIADDNRTTNNGDWELVPVNTFFKQLTTHTVTSGTTGYSIMQGGCNDGTYAYYAYWNGDNNTKIVRYSLSTFSRDTAFNHFDYRLGHANDMTYIPANYLAAFGGVVIAKGGGSWVDNIVQFISMGSSSWGISLNELRSVSNIAFNTNNSSFAVLSSTELFVYDRQLSFTRKTLLKKPIEYDEYTSQGIDCDKDYIYVVKSPLINNVTGKPHHNNTAIFTYDWYGNLVNFQTIAITDEVENISHVGNTFYLGFNKGSGANRSTYVVKMEKF